jgi:hypothetical protein
MVSSRHIYVDVHSSRSYSHAENSAGTLIRYLWHRANIRTHLSDHNGSKCMLWITPGSSRVSFALYFGRDRTFFKRIIKLNLDRQMEKVAIVLDASFCARDRWDKPMTSVRCPKQLLLSRCIEDVLSTAHET